jgi:hypothetical protein
MYKIALKHYQPPLISRVMSLAGEKNIPYEYAFKVFLTINSDMEKMLEDIKETKIEDNFEETYYKYFFSR